MKLRELFTEEKADLPELEIGDIIGIGKFKNKRAEIKGFTKDENAQPVVKTNKGDRKVFGFKLSTDIVPDSDMKAVKDEKPKKD